jgi:hypothetical protein
MDDQLHGIDLQHLLDAGNLNENPLSLFNLNCEYFDPDSNTQTISYKNKMTYMHHNIRSLPGKFDRLKILLANIEDNYSKPDVILLCETWLNSVNHNMYPLSGYNFVDNHRVITKCGGVAIYVKQGITFNIREDLSIFEEGTFESLFIELIVNNKHTIVGEMYRLPSTNEKHFLETYDYILRCVQNEKKDIVIGTDQNMDLLKFEQHTNIADLIDLNFSYGVVPTITKPTRITHNSATLIDNLYVSCKNAKKIESKVIVTDLSDHFPVMVYVDGTSPKTKAPLKFTARDINDVAIKHIKGLLQITDWTQMENMSIDDSFAFVHNSILEALDLYAPAKEVTIPAKNVFKEKWMSKGLFKSPSTNNKLYRKSLGKPKTPPVYVKYVTYRNLFNKLKRIVKQQYFSILWVLNCGNRWERASPLAITGSCVANI